MRNNHATHSNVKKHGISQDSYTKVLTIFLNNSLAFFATSNFSQVRVTKRAQPNVFHAHWTNINHENTTSAKMLAQHNHVSLSIIFFRVSCKIPAVWEPRSVTEKKQTCKGTLVCQWILVYLEHCSFQFRKRLDSVFRYHKGDEGKAFHFLRQTVHRQVNLRQRAYEKKEWHVTTTNKWGASARLLFPTKVRTLGQSKGHAGQCQFSSNCHIFNSNGATVWEEYRLCKWVRSLKTKTTKMTDMTPLGRPLPLCDRKERHLSVSGSEGSRDSAGVWRRGCQWPAFIKQNQHIRRRFWNSPNFANMVSKSSSVQQYGKFRKKSRPD